jgi:hypothetical protein
LYIHLTHSSLAALTVTTTAAAAAVAASGWAVKVYDVKALYGEPDVPAACTPLAVLLATDHSPIFDLPVLQLVVKLKWSIYGRLYYW